MHGRWEAAEQSDEEQWQERDRHALAYAGHTCIELLLCLLRILRLLRLLLLLLLLLLGCLLSSIRCLQLPQKLRAVRACLRLLLLNCV